jgi:gliding motility-associated-like protein
MLDSMKNLLVFLLLTFTGYGQYCPALGPDQILPCGVGTTTLTADLSQCGPGGIGPKQTTDYAVTNIPYAVQTNTGTSISMTDDSQQGPFNIGFNFCFFGQTYTQFYIGSNGWISFAGGQPTTFTSQTIPTGNALVPRNCIMGPWQDWHPGLGGQIRYQTTGVAPCRKLTVSWINVPMFSCTGNLGTFHIIIYESTNVIENHIQSKPACTQWQGGTAVEGIHNNAGTIGIPVPGRNSTAWTANNDAWRWTPNGPTVNPTLTWYVVGNPTPIGTGLSINVTPPIAGAQYTCRFVYPICNAGWSTCNPTIGFGPDTVFVMPGPAIPVASPIISSDTICVNSPSEIYSVIFQSGVTYVWDAVSPIISGQGTDSIAVDWSGTLPGFIPGGVMVTPEANGCIGVPVSFDLYILDIQPTIDPIGPFCEYNDNILLTVNPIGGNIYGVGVVNNNFIPSNAVGTNTITYEYMLSGCIFDTSTIVTVYPKPTLDSIIPHNTFFELCELETTTVTWTALGNPSGYNEWTWDNQLLQQNSLTQTFGWDSARIYIVSAVHWANGCVSDPQSTSITITQCPETIFYMPNTFTPDGDEFNQIWQPIITSGIAPLNFELLIFNRWGQIIWESHDISAGWDGTYDNKSCSEGVYFYMAECTDVKTAKKFLIQGHLTLLR